MIENITLILLILLLLIFIGFLISFKGLKDDVKQLYYRLSDLEDIQSIDYMVPYEKKGKKGKKRIKHMIYKDENDEIYQEEKSGKMYHESKK
jgi:hypothetical protein